MALPRAPRRASTSLSLLADGMTYYSCPDFFNFAHYSIRAIRLADRSLQVDPEGSVPNHTLPYFLGEIRYERVTFSRILAVCDEIVKEY